ncbi:MAG: hypothetical protein ABIP53_08375 [Candidatus Limnocylindrales bacterium]
MTNRLFSIADGTHWSARAVVLVVLITLVGCASTSVVSPAPSVEPSPDDGHSDTSYGRLFAQVQPDGTVSKDVALLAFSTAIATLPGVPVAEGGPPSDFERADGTFAITWLRPYLEELTAEQRAAVDAALQPSASARLVEPQRQRADISGALALQGTEDAKKPYKDAIDSAVTEIARRLHRTLKAPVKFDFGPQPADPKALAYSNPAPAGHVPQCDVRATPLISESSEQRIRIAMAHEVFHCFQFEVMPGGLYSSWIVEGQAEWAGEDIAGPGPDGLEWWKEYLKNSTDPLFERTYDGVGFYEHLVEVGVDPWTIFDAMLKTPGDNIAAFKAAKADNDIFYNTWASGYRRTEVSPASWYAYGRWQTNAHSRPELLEIANDTSKPVYAESVANALFLAHSTADITEISVEGPVRILTGTLDVPDVQLIDLCTKGPTIEACECPPGQDYTGPILYPSDGTIWLGVSGALRGTSGTIAGRKLEQWCKPKPSGELNANPRGGPHPCAKGCAGSIGDPHLDTLDDQHYDFQAAGEYTLLRSTDGTIEIQGRQVPYPDVRDASITTALAWKVGGHRIGMYAQQGSDTYSLRLDGNVVDPRAQGTTDLGDGAALTLLARGIEVAYGDGTITTAFFHGNGFADALDIQIAPSDALKAQGTGLLGPTAAGSELPALPDGSALPLSADRVTRFTQRYLELGPAWHITDVTSLFDYEPGQTSATFDQPGFPTQDVAFTVEELQEQQGVVEFQKAAEKCAALGGDQELIVKCVFDVMATKDPAYAQFYAQVQQFLADGPLALELTAVEFTPPPPPTPSAALPAGFFNVATGVSLLRGAAIGPDGRVYASVLKPGFSSALFSVDSTTGAAGSTIETTGSGTVLFLAGSLWVAQDDITGYGRCVLERFDPLTLVSQTKIPIGCDIFGPSVAAVADGVWWLDRSTSDADGNGAMLRHIDPATNQVDRSVELPFVNGYLQSSSTTVFFGDSGGAKGWYRLTPGATAFTSLGLPPRPFEWFPAGEGAWFQPLVDNSALFEADFVTASATPEARLPFVLNGVLAGADGAAVYVASRAGPSTTLLRYATDGSAPTTILTGATLTTPDGVQNLDYVGGQPLIVSGNRFAKLWMVSNWPDEGTTSLIAQVTTSP